MRPIYTNATFKISSRRNHYGTDLWVLTYREETEPSSTRIWSGEGRNIWEALTNAIYNACEAGWIKR